jgi:protein-tyrosine phosphatase
MALVLSLCTYPNPYPNYTPVEKPTFRPKIQEKAFDLTPIPFPAPSAENVALQKKIDRCSRHIARLENSLSYRRTDKHTVSLLINEFKQDESDLKRRISNLQAEGKWEENSVEKLKSLPRGKLFRGKMPVNGQQAIKELNDAKITTIFLLCSDKECRVVCGTDLGKLYAENGVNVVHFPVADFGAWPQDEFNKKIHQLYCRLMQGENVLVHCRGGIGRTGSVIAAVSSKILKMDGESAIDYARKHSHPYSVETKEQKSLVENFAKKYSI